MANKIRKEIVCRKCHKFDSCSIEAFQECELFSLAIKNLLKFKTYNINFKIIQKRIINFIGVKNEE